MTRIDNLETGIIFLDKVRKSLSQQTQGGKNIHGYSGLGIRDSFDIHCLENCRQLIFGFSECHFHFPSKKSPTYFRAN